MDSIIFDVDGTLWDSTGIVAEAWSDYLIHTEHMDTDVSAKRLMGLFGQLLPDIAKALFPELPEAEQLRIIDGCCQAEHEALLRKCAPLYPDLEETLKILSSRFPLFIVSNCQAGYIEVFLKSTGFGHYFKGHLCPGDTGMAKAENIMKIREDNNLSDPVYIGDTIGDFNACRKAGVPFIFAEYGFGQVDKPDYRITSLLTLRRYADEYEKIKIHRPYFRSDPENAFRACSSYHASSFLELPIISQICLDRASGLQGSCRCRCGRHVCVAFPGTSSPSENGRTGKHSTVLRPEGL